MFLIRGQDTVGPEAVRCWADLASDAGADPAIVKAARAQAAAMEDWQLSAGRAKVPDLPQ